MTQLPTISRRFIHISGNENWAILTAKQILNPSLKEISNQIICCGSSNDYATFLSIVYIDSAKKRSEIENILGSEYFGLIFNCYAGFNPDLFCALVGLIKSPGFIILLTPNTIDWPSLAVANLKSFSQSITCNDNQRSRFISFFSQSLLRESAQNWFELIKEGDVKSSKIKQLENEIYQSFLKYKTRNLSFSITTDQQRIATKIRKIFLQQSSCVLVIQGKRGRGKTTALGHAFENLIKISNETVSVAVISQSRNNVLPIFNQIEKVGLKKPHHIDYFPPDVFLKDIKNHDLILIDEAASIPLTQLETIIKQYSKVILSSTNDGYEGTGMGFSTKFMRFLEYSHHSIIYFELNKPHRWLENDPIEMFLHSTLLPNNKNVTSVKINIDELRYVKINRDSLIKDTRLTLDFFNLLANAHYRTTPDDLKLMLDARDVEIWAAKDIKNTPCAAMLICKEGMIDSNLSEPIWLGKRRIQGQIIPQALSFQCGFSQAVNFSYLRIIRIAVLKEYRNLGIGTHLVGKMQSEWKTSSSQIDFLSVSFANDNHVINFWNKLNFNIVNLGNKANARSGEKSLIMLQPLTCAGVKFQNDLLTNYKINIEFNSKLTLQDPYLNYPMLLKIGSTNEQAQIPNKIKFDVYSFSYGHRQFLNCYRSLYITAVKYINSQCCVKRITDDQLKLITYRVLQNKNWPMTSQLLKLTGKKQALTQLRHAFSIIYADTWGNKL